MGNSFGILRGNVTRDPEMKFVGSDGSSALLRFSIAAEKSWKQNGEWQKEVSFFDIVAWRKLAENNVDLLSKGMPIVVLGEWSQQRWEDDDGNKRSRNEFVATCIAYDGMGLESVVRKRRGDGQASSGGGNQPRVPAYDIDEEPF